MSSDESSGWTRGQQGVFWIFVVAVFGLVILVSNQDNEPPIDATLRWILAAPAFLFIAPPGWVVLGFIAQKLNEQSNEPLIAADNPDESISPLTEENVSLPVSAIDHLESLIDNKSEDSSFAEMKPETSLDNTVSLLKPYDEVSEEVFLSLEFAKRVAGSYQWRCQRCYSLIQKDADWKFFSSNLQRLVIERIIPTYSGGKNTLANAQPRHGQCLSLSEREELRKATSNSFKQHTTPPPKVSPRPMRSQPSRSESIKRKSEKIDYETIERPGDWSSPHIIINQLMKSLDSARISDTQRERAREFLTAEHVNDLMKTCQRGHRMSLENTYFSPPENGYIQRQCRACRRLTGH